MFHVYNLLTEKLTSICRHKRHEMELTFWSEGWGNRSQGKIVLFFVEREKY